MTKSTVYDPDASTLDTAIGDDDLTTEPHQTRHHRKDDTGTVCTSPVTVLGHITVPWLELWPHFTGIPRIITTFTLSVKCPHSVIVSTHSFRAVQFLCEGLDHEV